MLDGTTNSIIFVTSFETHQITIRIYSSIQQLKNNYYHER